MEHKRLSQDVCYDVCVKVDVDHMGRSEFSEPIARFREQRNAVAYMRRLEARGETVHVHKSAVYDLSEAVKEKWYRDYEPKVPSANPPGTFEGTIVSAPSPPLVDGSESSDGRREPWYRRWFGG